MSPGRLAPALLAILLLAALVSGCGGGSAQRSIGSEPATGGGSAEETGSRETVRGTTSRGSATEAESTVGIVPPELDTGETAPGSAEQTGEASAPVTGESPARQGGRTGGGSGEAPVDERFVASPEDSGGSGYGADGILGVRFGEHEGYERVVVDLGSGGEPASGVPEWTLSSPTGDGRLKLTFPSVRDTAVSDGSLEEAGAELLDSFYVVRGPDGGMFVDFFAERAFYYRVIQLPDPARVAIDFKPSGSDLAIPLPVREGNTVLTEPRLGDDVTSPLTISGYSRNPEASNTVLLQGPGGETLARETTLSNDWSSTWGYFETTLDFSPFAGEGTLKVGARSARDGSFEGVEIPIDPESP